MQIAMTSSRSASAAKRLVLLELLRQLAFFGRELCGGFSSPAKARQRQ
jgi:hypothetical protein